MYFATFQIEENAIQVNREARLIHMIEDKIDMDSTRFLDKKLNSFRDEITIL